MKFRVAVNSQGETVGMYYEDEEGYVIPTDELPEPNELKLDEVDYMIGPYDIELTDIMESDMTPEKIRALVQNIQIEPGEEIPDDWLKKEKNE